MLSAARRKQCLSNGVSCRACFTSNCNSRKTLPVCYISPPDGEYYSLEPQNSKECMDYNDTCFIEILNGKVNRGCFNEYANDKQLSVNFLEENKDNVLFKSCDDHKCNDDVVKQTSCIKCDSDDDSNCYNPTVDMVQTCAISIYSTSCYHYNNGTKVIRGCMSEVHKELQESCANNSDECKICAGDGCNDRSNFQQCKSCENNDNCESEICHDYSDECFIHVQGHTITRGCLNSAKTRIRRGCESSQIGTCEKCSDRNDCNDRDIEEETCLECDSVNVDDCFLKPNASMVATCPLSLKPLGCYLIMKEGNKAERGCMSSMHKNELVQCRDGRGTCKACMGNNCNMRQRFQSCISCDSTKSVYCEKHVKTAIDITCPDYFGTCYTHVGNDKVVRRGCVGDTNMPTKETCEGLDCEWCGDQNRCNKHELFQSICYECDSKHSNCMNLKSMDTQTCKLTLKAKGCYHRIEHYGNQTHVSRGCLSSLSSAERNACGEHTNTCKTCKSNKCNKQQGFSKCIECSSDVTRNCIWRPEDIKPVICPVYDNKCFTFIGTRQFIRGCLKKQDTNLWTKCKENSKKCEKCDPNSSGDGAICNAKVYNLATCYACDSKDNSLCTKKPEKMPLEICNLVNEDPNSNQECYLSIEGDRYKRGCMSSLVEPKQTECRNNVDTCKMCVTKNCNNRKEFHECVMCNSNDDPQCVSNAVDSKTGICEQYSSICIVGIDDYGVTHRRCCHDYIADIQHFSKGIKSCEGNNCNFKLFPADRKQCFQCSGDEDCDYPSDTEMIKPCAVVSPYDRCYTFMNKSEDICISILHIFRIY